MPIRPWIWLDGRFLRAGDPCLSLADWESAHRVGIRVSAHAYGTQLRHFSPYYALLLRQIEQVRLPAPAYLSEEAIVLAVRDLLNKNREFRNVVVHFTAFLQFRADSLGISSPTTSILIHTEPRDERFFQLGGRGLLLEYFFGMRRSLDDWSGVHWLSEPLRWQAEHFARSLGLPSCLLMNDQNRVVEALRGTLYVRRGSRLFTPPIAEGVTNDPVREFVPHLAHQVGGYVVEEQPLTREHIHQAEEVFLVSSVFGVKSVLGVEGRRYAYRLAPLLLAALNTHFFPEQV